MTLRQVELGDRLLQFLVEKNGKSDKDQYPIILEKEGYEYYKEVAPTVDRLAQQGLVEFYNRNHCIRLTNVGYEVAELGILGYAQRIHEKKLKADENLELQNEALKYQQKLRHQDEKIKRLTITNLKLQNRNLRLSIVMFLLGAGITFIASNLKWFLELLKQ